MKRVALLVLLLSGAAVFYTVGYASGALVLVAVGGLFELRFWVTLFRRSPSS